MSFNKPKYLLDPNDPMMAFFVKGYMAANAGRVPTFEELNDWLSLEIEKSIQREGEEQ